jgi:chemotaxis protein histidine kinase CheA
MSDLTVQNENSLQVDGQIYSLDTAPDYNAPLVQKEAKSVLGQLNLKDITENLDLCVELFYVAYNGVAGAKGGTIQAEVAVLQSQLAMLCNECVKTMGTFEAETRNIIGQLTQTYGALTKGQEQFAIKKMAHCSESSTEMSEKASDLAKKFKALQVESTKTRATTIVVQTSQRDSKLAAQKAQEQMEAKQAAEQTNQKELVDQIVSAQTLYDEAKEREEREATKSLILGITSAITSAVGSGLGAFAATRNPVGSVMASVASASGSNSDNTQLTTAQKNVDEKKTQSDSSQKLLLTAKDVQTTKQNVVNKLNDELKDLNERISEKEKDSSTKKDELDELKERRDAKQLELGTRNEELHTAEKEVVSLEESAKGDKEAYASAALALQELAKQTGQMTQAAASVEESIRQEKMKWLDQKLSLEKEKRESLVKLAEYAASIKNFKVEEGNATLSLNSLHSAVEALGKIIGTLTNASLFWDQMSTYCARMSTKGFQQKLNDLISPDSGFSKEQRIAEYRDTHFMKDFLTYLCQWVAVNGLSGEYLISAGLAQRKAVDYLKKSPTIEEAIRKAPELASNLQKIIDADLTKSREASTELEQQKAVFEKMPTGSSPA